MYIHHLLVKYIIILSSFPPFFLNPEGNVLWPSLSHMGPNCPPCVNIFSYCGTVIINWINNPLVTAPAMGLHGYRSLLNKTTPAEVADRCIFWCRFLPITHINTICLWETALSHKDFTQLDLCPLINMTGSTNSKELEVHHHSVFPNNHVYITISTSFWVDWVMILLHWNT